MHAAANYRVATCRALGEVSKRNSWLVARMSGAGAALLAILVNRRGVGDQWAKLFEGRAEVSADLASAITYLHE